MKCIKVGKVYHGERSWPVVAFGADRNQDYFTKVNVYAAYILILGLFLSVGIGQGEGGGPRLMFRCERWYPLRCLWS